MTVGVCLHGHFKVTIQYRGKTYSCVSTNTIMYDVIWHDDKDCGYTRKQAFQSLYNYCKRKHQLN